MSVAIQPQAVQASTQVSTQHSGIMQMMEEACQGMSVEESSKNSSYAQMSNPAPPPLPAPSGSEGTEHHAFFGPIPGTRSNLPQGPYKRSPQIDPSPITPPLEVPAPMEVPITSPQIDPAPKQPKTQQDMGGQWMYNSGWTGQAHPCLLGWLFVQG